MVLEASILLAVAVFTIIHAFSLHSFGEWALSPGLFPLIVGVVLFVLSILLLGRRGYKKRSNEGFYIDWKIVLTVTTLSIAYVLLLSFFHFALSTFIYLALFFLVLGVRNLLLLGVLSFGLTLFVYYTFGVLLRVVLP
ncbi:MAG: Uncharacterized protein XD57_1686 [Thermotoga petrophila]|uniref:DUF1468 domain-containing protein n=1 Tax=Thermotoga petrophila TaxID=93929 RepID=A0A101EPP3_9THEM|nr:MAG: Uncharacterized protein XD57_1686 [Thermotoga petrophila]MDK2871758.1 putative tricarboxylic transport rane protein [bacterium]